MNKFIMEKWITDNVINAKYVQKKVFDYVANSSMFSEILVYNNEIIEECTIYQAYWLKKEKKTIKVKLSKEDYDIYIKYKDTELNNMVFKNLLENYIINYKYIYDNNEDHWTANGIKYLIFDVREFPSLVRI